MGLYVKVPIAECLGKTGKQPISVRWIDINKGDQESPNYRSRLVAREINSHNREDLFAATPPLEALQAILSMTATAKRGEVVMINDIGRAVFHARTKGDVYVQLVDDKHPVNKDFVESSNSPCTARATRRKIGSKSIRAS